MTTMASDTYAWYTIIKLNQQGLYIGTITLTLNIYYWSQYKEDTGMDNHTEYTPVDNCQQLQG